MAGIRAQRWYLPAGPPGRDSGGRGPAPVRDHVHRIMTTVPCPPAQDIGHMAYVRTRTGAWRPHDRGHLPPPYSGSDAHDVNASPKSRAGPGGAPRRVRIACQHTPHRGCNDTQSSRRHCRCPVCRVLADRMRRYHPGICDRAHIPQVTVTITEDTLTGVRFARFCPPSHEWRACDRGGQWPARDASGCEKLLDINLPHAARGGDDDRPGRQPTPAVAR